jgi:hypothetical protein
MVFVHVDIHREEIWWMRNCVFANVKERDKPQVPPSNGHRWIIRGRTTSTGIAGVGKSDQATSGNRDRKSESASESAPVSGCLISHIKTSESLFQ